MSRSSAVGSPVTAAFLLARDGVDVALVEAADIAGGTTGNTTAKVSSAHGLCYAGLAGNTVARRPAPTQRSTSLRSR